MAPALVYQRLRAPRNDGEVLLVPSLADCLALPRQNQKLIDSWKCDFFGEPIGSLRTSARQELLTLAGKHTAAYADVASTFDSDTLVVMSGHQPELFHPGVWAKNFAIDRIAKHLNGVAIQVIIDNDLMRDHAIRMPTGRVDSPEIVTEPFDLFCDPVPFETRAAQDVTVLESFPQRVCRRIEPFVDQPLIAKIWPNVVSSVRQGQVLGLAFARSRHLLELQWGLKTLEIPLSQLCETNLFRKFAVYLLQNGESLLTAYNARLEEYRRVHRLRSAAQPLPNLRRDGAWAEAPFWVWSDNDPFRRSLWCRKLGEGIEISDRVTNWTLADTLHNPDVAVNELSSLSQSVGFRIRPRALTSTMFLRLFQSDVFVHGIGGAKYDQITDLLIHDVFGIRPPGMIALSQTTMLPVDIARVSAAELAKNRQTLREMYFHPERFLGPETEWNTQVSSIVKTKKNWLAKDLPSGERLERHEQISVANAQLRTHLEEKAANQRNLHAQLESGFASSRILSSREWSFSLFPEQFLRDRLLDICSTDS